MRTIEKLLGDFLGAESYIDFSANVDDVRSKMDDDGGAEPMERRTAAAKKEYPPPLPWLPRTDRLRTSEMPWVMKRSCTEDGRLIITMEMAESYRYFRVHRSDQWVRLELIVARDPFSDQLKQEDNAADDDHEIIETASTDEFVPAESSQASGGMDTVATIAEATSVIGSSDDDDGSGSEDSRGNNCSSSLIFGVPMPAIHTIST